jgi:TonB family protein
MKARTLIEWCAGLAILSLGPGTALAQKPAKGAEPPRITSEKSGTFTARDGGRLKLVTDMGTVRLITQPGASQVSYRIRLEADASQPDAQALMDQFNVVARGSAELISITGTVPWKNFRGRLLVNYEVRLPARYNVEVTTYAGNIRMDDIEGQVTLLSAGGNLTAGNITGTARLETKGGHITLKDVAGNLNANTLGGHINAGNIKGDAVLRSSGGHVTVVSVGGLAQMETAGGNISLQRGGANVAASTAGGRIDVGEATGAVRAHSLGGGIRVVRLTGPTQLETTGGSIYLTSMQGAVRATTGSGGITAWIPAAVKIHGTSQFESSHGDIVIYLPRELAITIEASVEGGGDHTFDPPSDVPVKVVSSGAGAEQRLRAEVALNGGGERLRLRAQHGNIRLRFTEDYKALYERIYKAQMQAFERNREWEQRMMENQLKMQEEMRLRNEKMKERQKEMHEQHETPTREQRGRLEEWSLIVREKLQGRIPVSAQIQQKKLIEEVRPQYPEAARREGIEGGVWLEALIDKDGKVESLNVINGHPVLAKAAVEAVRQWKYSPTYVGDKPVAVTTVIKVTFRLN